jgi:hypothetical protein
MSWFRLTQDEKQKDFELAVSLATGHPDLFEVGHEYEFADFQKAIQHVSSPGKTGIVSLRSPFRKDNVWKSEPLEQEPSHKLSPNVH